MQKTSFTNKSIHRLLLEKELINLLSSYDLTGKMLELGSKNKKYCPFYSNFSQVIFSDLNPSEKNVLEIDSRSIPFKDQTFDCIIALEMIEYQLDFEKTFDEIYRVLKKGGFLIISSPVFNEIHSDSIRITPDSLNDFINSKKFNIIESIIFGNYFTIGIDLYKRYSKTFIVRFLFKILQRIVITLLRKSKKNNSNKLFPSGNIILAQK